MTGKQQFALAALIGMAMVVGGIVWFWAAANDDESLTGFAPIFLATVGGIVFVVGLLGMLIAP